MHTVLPLSQAFSTGGFLNLSGLAQEQLLADEIGFVRGIYRTRFLCDAVVWSRAERSLR